jgi:O-antigen ligase
MFVSRAMMSIGMMTLVGAALLHENVFQNFKSFLANRSYVVMSLYYVVMAITFFWSEDHHYFFQRMTIMLPFLVLPFSFHSFSKENSNWLRYILIFFLILVIAGNMYSLWNYFGHKSEYDLGYSYSKVIPTPFKNDHIRYSMAVVAAIAYGLYLLEKYSKLWPRILLIGMILFHVVFIHVLSAKTGLVSLYLLAFLYLVYLLKKKSTRKWAFLVLSFIILTPLISYQYSTSFRNKLWYLQYSLVEMKNNNRQVNVSDEGRIVSYQYAWENIRKYPILGVGLGDVYHEMDIRFKRDFPARTDEPLLPHNQFVMVLMAGGILALLYLIFFQIFWFMKTWRNEFLHFSIFGILLFGMMIDSLFETQYGACIYVFLILFNDSHLYKSFIMNKRAQ